MAKKRFCVFPDVCWVLDTENEPDVHFTMWTEPEAFPHPKYLDFIWILTVYELLQNLILYLKTELQSVAADWSCWL